MMLFNELAWLHDNLPFPLLKLWGRSRKAVSFSMRVAFGGKKFVHACKLLEKMESWSGGRIYEFQTDMLREMLEQAYSNVPYYRKAFNKEGIKPSDIKCLDDMQKIPIMTKEDILKNYNQFFSKEGYKRKVYSSTSGTSGKSLRICFDDNHMAAFSANGRHMRRSFLGYTPPEDAVLHAGFVNRLYPILIPTMDKRKYCNFYSPVMNQVLFLHNFASPDTFRKCAMAIKKQGIKHVEGPPSVYFALAKYLREKNEELNVETALLKGETLYGFQRQIIEEQLNCEVFDAYGQNEGTIIAPECRRHKGMHILPLLGVAEIKGQGLEGEGELVMTNLWNRAWPIIRYNIKDTVKISRKRCSCGRVLPRLIEVQGRDNDIIILPDGNYLSSMPFSWFTIHFPEVKDIFFMQNKDFSIDVLVVKEKKASAERLKHAIKQRVKALSKGQLAARVLFTDSIVRKSYKNKVVETKIPWKILS